MIGLLKKDILSSLLGFRTLFMVLGMFAVIGAISDNGSIFLVYLVILPTMLANSMLAVEEREKWPLFAGTLPVSRKNQTMEKYLFSLVMNCLGLLVISIVMMIRREHEILAALTVFGSLGMIMPGITLPLTYQFGAEKARYVYTQMHNYLEFCIVRLLLYAERL